MRLLKSNPAAVHEAAEALRAGQLVAFPTETVYGLGADALNPRAVERIFRAKGRPSSHPLIVHVASLAAAKALTAEWPDSAQALATAFWPGPLTLVLRRADSVPDAVTGGQGTVGLRWPAQPTAQALLAAFATVGSGAVAAPSANRFGGVSPTLAEHVQSSLEGRLQEGDVILDDGSCDVGIESTIVDCTVDPPRVLRPGGLPREALSAVLRLAEAEAPEPSLPAPRVSGSLASHYAPRTPLRLVAEADLPAELAHWMSQPQPPKVLCWARRLLPSHTPQLTQVLMPKTPQALAQQLYARLHAWDREGFDLLVIECPPKEQAWEAVRDRLARAASADGESRTP